MKVNKKKPTILSTLLYLIKRRDYLAHQELIQKRENLKDAILTPSQDVFAQTRGVEK